MTFKLYYGNTDYFPMDISEVQSIIRFMISQKRRTYLGVKLLCWVSRMTDFTAQEYAEEIMGMHISPMIKRKIEAEVVHYGNH